MTVVNVLLELILENPWNTRGQIPEDDVIELADDIARNGLLQPPLARLIYDNGTALSLADASKKQLTDMAATNWKGQGISVQLAFGHRRLAAYKHNFVERGAGHGRMPVEIRVLTDEQMADYAWSENEKRKDVTPIERAKAIKMRMDAFHWTQEQAGKKLGLERSTVANILRVLKLPEEVQGWIHAGTISERTGLAVLALYELPESILQAIEKDHNDVLKTKVILEAVEAGRLTGDDVRNRVDSILDRYGRHLEKAPWKVDETLPVDGMQSVSCKECPLRLKERNWCLDRGCYDAKEEGWKYQQAKAASDATGIPVGEDPGYLDYSFTRRSEEILKMGCPNLRLVYARSYSASQSLKEQGFPNVGVMCSKRTGSCTCLKGLELAEKRARTAIEVSEAVGGLPPERTGVAALMESEAPTHEAQPEEEPAISAAAPKTAVLTAKDLEELTKKARKEKAEANKRKDELVEKFAQKFTRALQQENLVSWRMLAKSIHYTFSLEKTAEWDFGRLLSELGKYVGTAALPYDPESVEEIVQALNVALDQIYGEGAVDVRVASLLESLGYEERA